MATSLWTMAVMGRKSANMIGAIPENAGMDMRYLHERKNQDDHDKPQTPMSFPYQAPVLL